MKDPKNNSSTQDNEEQEKQPSLFSNIRTLATGSLASRSITVILAVLALAGVSTMSPPAAIAALLTVGAGIAVDIIMVRQTRKLHKESCNLARHRLAKDEQDKIFERNPNLAKILEKQLYQPSRNSKKSVAQRYSGQGSAKGSLMEKLMPILMALVGFVESIAGRNPSKVTKLIGLSPLKSYKKDGKQPLMQDKRNEFRSFIDIERAKDDSPGYNNSYELKLAARQQKIQALALQKLTNHPDFPEMSEAEIRTNFAEYKNQIENTEKAIKREHGAVRVVKNIFKDVIAANNPFSQYHDPKKLSTKLKNQNLEIDKGKSLGEKIETNARKFAGLKPKSKGTAADRIKEEREKETDKQNTRNL